MESDGSVDKWLPPISSRSLDLYLFRYKVRCAGRIYFALDFQ